MAPLLFRDMKGLSCSSQASTATCPSLERHPTPRPHKASAGASPLPPVPAAEPRTRTHRLDGKKGQQPQHKAAVVPANAGGGGLVSPAGSSRYLLLSGRFAAVAEEIQEVLEPAPAVDAIAKREEASDAADAKTAQAQEQVRANNPPLNHLAI
jgi:hypothetical protein